MSVSPSALVQVPPKDATRATWELEPVRLGVDEGSVHVPEDGGRQEFGHGDESTGAGRRGTRVGDRLPAGAGIGLSLTIQMPGRRRPDRTRTNG